MPLKSSTSESKELLRASAPARQIERRLFLRQGLSLGALTLLTGCDIVDGVAAEKALRAMSRFNDAAQALLFDPNRLAPTYPESAITKPFPFNAYYDEDEAPEVDAADFKLAVGGLVDDNAGVSRPLFTARVERLRVNYTFTARSFVRLIGQYVSTDRDPALFLGPSPAHEGFFSGSALFAYKINWQSVMFFGYGDDRTLDDQRRLQKSDRQIFVKLSHAFQR